MSPGQHSATSGVALFLVTMVTNVALVNLLVALFADTYMNVAAQAEEENSLAFHTTLFRHTHVHTVMPPPLNAPSVLWYLGTQLCAALRARCAPLATRAASSTTADDPPALEACDPLGGRLLVEAYVRQKEEKEALAVERVVDSVHGLVQGHGHEHSVALGAALETVREVSTRVGRLEAHVDARLMAVDEKLEAVLAHLAGDRGGRTKEREPTLPTSSPTRQPTRAERRERGQ